MFSGLMSRCMTSLLWRYSREIRAQQTKNSLIKRNTGLLFGESSLLREVEAEVTACEEVIHQVEVGSVLEGVADVDELSELAPIQTGGVG